LNLFSRIFYFLDKNRIDEDN